MDNNNDNMCSPSSDNLHRRSHNNNCKQQMKQHKLFDDSRKFLHKTQKFITADLCQIVDGQNYQSYRHATADKMKMIMMNKSCNDLSYYQPVSSRGGGGGSMKQSTSSATISTESSSYTTCDQLDVSQRSASPPYMLDWLRSATAQKKQQQQDRDRSSQSSLPDLEAIQRRRASASGSSRQRRRHSLQEPARISAARRLSGQSTSSESSSQPRVKLLHASKPMHRALSNQDISGILRPARYSSTNLADMAAGYELGDTSCSSPLIRRYREINRISNDMKKASLLAATSSHRLDFRSVSSLTRRSTASSTGQLNKSRQQAGRSLSRPNPLHGMGEEKNADWVASGVNFSQNMEVFVFQKR